MCAVVQRPSCEEGATPYRGPSSNSISPASNRFSVIGATSDIPKTHRPTVHRLDAASAAPLGVIEHPDYSARLPNLPEFGLFATNGKNLGGAKAADAFELPQVR